MMKDEIIIKLALIINHNLYNENEISYSTFSKVQDELLSKLTNDIVK